MDLSVVTVDENVETMSLELLFARWMMSSYLYYCVREVESPWTDAQFDYAGVRLLKNWFLWDHPHKKLVNMNNMTAGTGFNVTFPNRVRGAAHHWVENYHGTN